jgi:hypothetical protein
VKHLRRKYVRNVITVSDEVRERVGLYRRSGTWDDAMRRVLAIAFPDEKEWKDWK